MNAALATLFPPPVVVIQEASVNVEARHQEMIRGTSALHDVCLEELSPENTDLMLELVEQIRSHLLQCKAAGTVMPEAHTG